MQFEIEHFTRYDYSRAVFLEPHTFRLRPRSDSFQRLIRYELKVDPKPVVLTEALDAEGNPVAHAWFSEITEFLELRVSFEAETFRANSFDYLLLDRAGEELPLHYSESLRSLLAPALNSPLAPDSRQTPAQNPRPGADGPAANGPVTNGPVADFAHSIAAGVNGQILPFLSELSRQIHQQIEVPIRETGHPLPAEQTLSQRHGACRDVAVLFMECCRSQGIAARFVSGYQEGDSEAERSYMHAWAEVYIPGGGWRGYDPSHGLAIADRHIVVAASARPELASPTRGTFRGTGATSRMRTELKIRTS
jgi:transglutaminase-like putative cysteine protease